MLQPMPARDVREDVFLSVKGASFHLHEAQMGRPTYGVCRGDEIPKSSN
jgi:hypothetical protein